MPPHATPASTEQMRASVVRRVRDFERRRKLIVDVEYFIARTDERHFKNLLASIEADAKEAGCTHVTWFEPSEQEFERCFDCVEAEHRLDPAGVEQIFRHVKDDQCSIAEIGKALPGLGRKQDREPARMAENIAAASRCCRRRAPGLGDHAPPPGKRA